MWGQRKANYIVYEPFDLLPYEYHLKIIWKYTKQNTLMKSDIQDTICSNLLNASPAFFCFFGFFSCIQKPTNKQLTRILFHHNNSMFNSINEIEKIWLASNVTGLS